MPRTPTLIADDLQKMFVSTFSGKTRGRLSISKEDMRTLAERSNLQHSIVRAIMDELYKNHDLVLVIVGDVGFGIIEEKKVLAWRPVPKRLIK